jgi:hypothetical protein
MKIFGHTTSWWFLLEMMYNILENCGGTVLICIFCTTFRNKPFFNTREIKYELFMQQKGKHPK